MALGSGSIAFVGLNTDGNDDFAFVILQNLAAGDVIRFVDDTWNGTAFTGTESVLTWTAPAGGVSAGSVVVIGNADNNPLATASIGSVTGAGPNFGFSATAESLYAITGTRDAPGTFLAAISNDNFSASGLGGTGLTAGVNAIGFAGSPDGVEFTGPRDGQTNFANYLAAINNPDNWSVQSTDGTLILPIDSSSFSVGGQDATAPTLSSSNPADNSGSVAIGADIVLDFSENVQKGDGAILIRLTSDNSVIESIDVTSGAVTVSGATVTVNPAADLAPGTAYYVEVAPGAIADMSGNDYAGISGATPLNFTTANAVSFTSISAIQGAGQLSALDGQTVTTMGVVTAIDTNGSRGFYIQDANGDGNSSTSDAIFVFTNAAPTVLVGQMVSVTGTVDEFMPNGASAGSFSTTEIVATSSAGGVINVIGAGPAITATLIGGEGGLLPPQTNFADASAFYESLEGMLVTVREAVAVGPTNDFGELYTVIDNDSSRANGVNGSELNGRGALPIEAGASDFGKMNLAGGDFNPERLQIDDDNGVLAGFVSPDASVGAQLGNVTGIVNYDFGNYQVTATEAFTIEQPSTLVKETTALVGSADRLTVASYNAENLDPGDGAARFSAIAQEVLTNLKAPDIVALQEVQDNDGPGNTAGSSVKAANVTLQTLVDALNTAAPAGVQYAFIDNPFIGDDRNGGEPGGNIRNAFIYRTDRVDFVDGSLKTIGADGSSISDPAGNTDQQTSADNPFFDSRPPLAATFQFNGEDVTIVNNHFTSKGGSGALYGSDASPLNAGEVQRAAQAQAVNSFVDGLLGTDPDAKILVAGDLNDFGFEEPLSVVKGTATVTNYDVPASATINATATYTPGGTQILQDLQDILPVDERYDYVFEGNAQTLDHMLASNGLQNGAQFDVVRINAEFADQTSDHDPLVASFNIPAPAQNFTLQLLHFSDGEAGLLASETAPNLAALVDAFDDDYANTLILSGGDNFLPGPFIAAGTDLSIKPVLNAVTGSTISSSASTQIPIAAVDIAILNSIGVEASTIGNHEFDLGSRVLRDALTPNSVPGWVGADFVYLSSNLDFSGDADLNTRFTNTLDGGTGTLVAEASTLKGRIAPSAVITEGGEKIGLVGVTTQLLESISSPTGTEVKGFPTGPGANGEVDNMLLLAAQLQPIINELIAEGVNKIILQSHLQQIGNEQQLAILLTGVDIILSAGSNTRLADADDELEAFPGHEATADGTYPIVTQGADGKTTLIVNTDGEFTYLGRLVVEFDANGDIVLDSVTTNQPINGAYASTDENVAEAWNTTVDNLADTAFADGTKGDKVEKLTEAVQGVINVKDSNVYGFTDVYLEGERAIIRNQETNLGDITADANAFAASEALGDMPFLVSLKNGGGIRAQIGTVSDPDPVTGDIDKLPPPANPDANKPAGAISQLDVENALRFDNKLIVFDTTPQGLLNILNWGAGLSANNGGFPQIGGVRFSFDPDLPGNSGTTPGSRIRDVALVDENGNIVANLVDDGVVLADAPALISVVTLNFTANGGDGYPIKANAENFRYLLNDGTVSASVSEALDFTAPANVPTNALGEQQAFAEYLQEFHSTPETAYNQADTAIADDTRIQNLNFRDDTVLDGAVVDDTFEAYAGSPVTGLIDGGGGNDTIKLIGPGVGVLGANVNFENLEVQSGVWTLQSDAYDLVTIAAGATVMSQLKLADQGEMTVAAGGSVIAIGNNAVVAEGSADIENSGIIQGLGMAGAVPANAIVLNGGEVYNKAGGIILAQGVAIASGAVATAGVAITNEGLIQGLSGQAIKLVGDQDDTVTNKSAINGSVDLGAGDDALVIHSGSSISGAATGGDGIDTIELVGTTPSTVGSFNSISASGFEKLIVAEGTWSVTGSEIYNAITVMGGATVTSRTILSGSDTLVVEDGGVLDQFDGANTATVVIDGPATGSGMLIDNSGRIDSHFANRTIVADFANGESTNVTLWNRATGVIENRDSTTIQISGGQQTNGPPLTGVFTLNNDGQILGGDRAIDTASFRGGFVLNNYATGLIESDSDGTAIRGGGTFNNWGTIRNSAENPNSDGDAIDFRSFGNTKVHNYSGALIQGGQHAVTGDAGLRVFNGVGGTMIGLNGSAVNVDNNGTEAERVFITNLGTMEGRSAETEDSDGDAIDVDGLAQILNNGRISGLGAEGYHNGEPNVSEAIAFGGGSIVNNTRGQIYGYGRGIQVDDSGNGAAFAATTIVNDGLIQGDGNGPEGVAPADAARFDLRGNEAINLIGDYEDFVGNNSTGRIIGGVSMGGARDTLNNSGSIIATGGSAIDMGTGNDQVNLYVGSTVTGTILLGDGDDVANSTSASAYVIDGGNGNDSIFMSSTIFGGNDVLLGGNGNDSIYGGLGNDQIDGGADNDTLFGEDGNDLIEGGAGDDAINGGNGADAINGGDGNDTIVAGSGDAVAGGAGDDVVEVATVIGAPASINGGEGDDTVKLLGAGTGALGATTAVENLVVQEGTWSVAASNYASVTIEGGATMTSTVALNNNDRLTVEAGGKLVSATAITWAGGGDAVVENSGLIEASSRVFNTTAGATGSFTFNNGADGVVRGALSPQQRAAADGAVTINNAGLMEASGRVIDFQNLAAGGAEITINNLSGGTIRQTGSDTDVIRPGQNTTVNNSGTITTAPGFNGGGDLIDYQSSTGGKVNNYAGGLMEGSRHVVTGDNAVTVYNEGTMIGRNGSAVNIDNGGSVEETVLVRNYGIMEGRSAELANSDGDAIDVDGLVQLLNYGRVAGLGAEGYNDGEPNVSEGVAIGGGTIVNSADAEIYGYGRGIQVDNSSNANALGTTTIVNDGLIQGDGNGPEGVAPADAARFDLRGNEAINLVGEYEDFVGNNSTGRIIGGVSMGGARDTLNNSGSIVATGGSAIDMGAGNDQVNLYVGATVAGTILLGTGDDVALATSTSDFVIEGGDGSDTMAMDAGDDVLSGDAGNDFIYGGGGDDRIDGGLDNDTLYGNAGDDLIEGGAGDDFIDGGNDDDVIFGDTGNDTIIAGLGNDNVKGNAGNDVFAITATSDGRDSYDGGDGIDTLDFSAFATSVNLTLRDGTTTYATDTIENIENVLGGSAADRLTGNSLDNTLTGNSGDDVLRGLAGVDKLDGGDGNDDLDGGANNDILSGGLGNDVLKGGAGDDAIKGGAGNDTLTGGAGFDQFSFSSVSDGIDTITDFRVSGASMDQLALSASMFQGFSGDDAFDLIGSGFLRAVSGSGSTQIQIDIDGGANSFQTLALLTGNFSNGQIADHTIVVQDPVA